MSDSQQARLLHLHCEMQALVSERMAMTVANMERDVQGLAPAYGEDAYRANAAALRALVPDAREFA